jgi:signal peptidase I
VPRWPSAVGERPCAWGLTLLCLAATACGMLRVNIMGDAMAPTLNDGDSAIATRRFDLLGRGDIVAFRYPRDESKSFVKRIIGLPGNGSR